MHRTSMGPIVSASAALVAAVAFLSAGCTPSSVPTPKAVPTAATLEPASASVPAQASGNPVTETQLAQLWRPVAVGADKGDYTAWGVVVDAQTGDILLDEDAAIGHTPASTTKTLAAFSALKHLDPTATLTTSALLGADNQTLYLIRRATCFWVSAPPTRSRSRAARACRPSRRTRPRPWRSAASRR